MDAELLKNQLTKTSDGFLPQRRGIILASLLGIGAMSAVTLLQMGVVKHLPDPPLSGFDSDRVNTSRMAYMLGVPDGAVSLAGLSLNILLSAIGGPDRTPKMPWLPIIAGAQSGIVGLATIIYFLDMPLKQKAWCPYCITGALANWAIMSLAAPEAIAALRVVQNRSTDKVAA
jgi:uncharacterized membrane protein